MTSVDPMASAPENETAPGEGWAEAGVYADAASGFEHGLVALAMGLPYVLREGAGEAAGRGYALLVPPEARDAVRGQLELFDRENAGWPPAARREAIPRKWRESLFLALVWAWAVIACFAAQQRWPELTEAGAMDALAVFAGAEWWRPFTALFLHAGADHLVSNLAGGVFLFAVLFSVWGRVKGALLLGLSAAAGNLAVGAARYPAEYRSLGASTALFAALGMLTGRALRRAATSSATVKDRAARGGGASRSWRSAWVPLGAGVTMLMLYGGGEAPVDVAAHAAGFASGCVTGYAFSPAEKTSPETPKNDVS